MSGRAGGGRGPRQGGGRRAAGGKGTSAKSSGAGRGLTARVKTAGRRSASSTRWLNRQLNDPYVARAKRERYRSRAAFKLAQLDDRIRFLRRGARVVDLGAAPGGWTQVAVERVGRGGRVVAIDVTEMTAVPGAVILSGDVRSDQALSQVRAALEGQADVVLSDMAAPATGHAQTDHLRVMALVEVALDFAESVLAPGGTFVAKVLQGGTEPALLARLKQAFATVRHVKPPASRAESAELYLVATGFRSQAHGGRE
ncbi:MAG TPA: RlmE family RNA methyltransferase [Kiloniellales bacterium]